MKRDEAGCNMQQRYLTCNCTRALLVLLAWLSCTAVECIIVPSGKVGPITPYRPTPRPTPDPSRIRDPAPVVEYSPENPEPPPLDPSYVPQSFKTLSALSGNSIFYIPLKIRNIHEFQGNSFSYVTQHPQPNPNQQQTPNDQKFVTWKATYNTPSAVDNQQPDVRIPVPVQEVDYSFPKKNRYRQQMKPIFVPPLPPVPQDYYHYNYYDKQQQQQQQSINYNYNTNNNFKNKYEDPLEDKTADQNNYRYSNPNNGHYPKKYNRNTDGSTTKYYYYVKHDYRTDTNNNNNNNSNNDSKNSNNNDNNKNSNNQ